jgi:hypothetical protein
MNERRACPIPKRTLTERKIIDEQGTWGGRFTGKVYQFYSSVDFPVIGLLDFITIPHS